jgi:hypothetical protein
MVITGVVPVRPSGQRAKSLGSLCSSPTCSELVESVNEILRDPEFYMVFVRRLALDSISDLAFRGGVSAGNPAIGSTAINADCRAAVTVEAINIGRLVACAGIS